LTRKPLYETKTVSASGKREAQRIGNRWEDELRQGDLTGDGGTFAQLCEEALRHAERRMSPNTLSETRRIVRTYLAKPLGAMDVASIRTRTLDVLYAELAARGGRCQHRPCPRPPCPGHPGERCNRVGCTPPCPGHPGARCERKSCERRCPVHDGACASWVPCKDTPCEHGASLSAATVHRIHSVVRSLLEQAVAWGWISKNPAVRANPGQIIEDEIDPPDEPDVIRLLAEA